MDTGTNKITPRTDFEVGETAQLSRIITLQDIEDFARLTGDVNPVHLDEEYARGTRFGGRIAHGALVASLISAVLGTKLPGPGSIYMNQQLRFTAPVHPGDTITAHATVSDWDPERRRITLQTDVIDQDGVTVITGEAQLLMRT